MSSSVRTNAAATAAAALGLVVTTLLGLQLTGAHATGHPLADAAPTATAAAPGVSVQPDSLGWGG
ncbi:hypothetical protein [Peterkaempfera sp. SMS 1(5)a]|uniref:hypothetical protein n=1 Tax=Peterkaempfera podocarpi TaxID=3232308 RepID=UPI0036713F11